MKKIKPSKTKYITEEFLVDLLDMHFMQFTKVFDARIDKLDRKIDNVEKSLREEIRVVREEVRIVREEVRAVESNLASLATSTAQNFIDLANFIDKQTSINSSRSMV